MYRSDVRLIINKQGLDIIKELCNKEIGEFQKTLVSRAKINENFADLIYLGWERINGLDTELIEKALKLLEDKDISYRVAIKGENFEDINMYEYISENDIDKKIPTPYVERIFNEDEIIQEIEEYTKSYKEKDEVDEIEYE